MLQEKLNRDLSGNLEPTYFPGGVSFRYRDTQRRIETLCAHVRPPASVHSPVEARQRMLADVNSNLFFNLCAVFLAPCLIAVRRILSLESNVLFYHTFRHSDLFLPSYVIPFMIRCPRHSRMTSN